MTVRQLKHTFHVRVSYETENIDMIESTQHKYVVYTMEYEHDCTVMDTFDDGIDAILNAATYADSVGCEMIIEDCAVQQLIGEVRS